MFFAYSALAVLLTLDAWRDPQHVYIGNVPGYDPEQSMYFMRWFQFALTHGHNPWLTDYLNFPAGINLSWNTGQPLLSLLLWPVAAVVGVVVALNVEMVLGLSLSGWCAYLACRRHTTNGFGAALGGLLYGFSPFLLAHLLGHPHFVFAVTPPLMFMLVEDITFGKRSTPTRLGILLGLLLAAQFLISEEILVVELLSCLVFFIVASALHRDQMRPIAPRVLTSFGTAAAISLIIVAWPMATQLFGPGRASQAIQAPDVFVSDLAGFVVPTLNQAVHPGNITFPDATPVGWNQAEWNGYLGLPLLGLLAIFGWRHWRKPGVQVVALVAVAVAILAMGPHLHVAGHRLPLPLPWWPLGHLPFLEKLLPARFMLIVFLLAAIALAWAWEWLWDSGRSGVAIACVLLTGASLAPRLPIHTGPASVAPAFFASGASVIPDGAPVLVLPYAQGPPVASMMWQAASNFRFRMPGGYFIGPASESPALPSWLKASDAVTRGQTPTSMNTLELRDELAAAGIHYVLVGPQAHRSDAVALVQSVLGDGRLYDDGDVAVWRFA